ncbi:hypothetical protein [Lyngbya confervoides]|uniref:Uncharacterized protein n=1 Tax=Lyngbya confervoides BDU141951 TaxID=1574623 RepID=A0ABD4SY12_9CYAN|nr:hypothetical protein [Lyngbya confervoides]MCM1981248.1 hypothetical protein [Lyngbya confervoides BDU141951]
MTFVLSLDDRGLEVFESDSAAIAACEGIDVEDGNFLFWDSAGQPLAAEFIRPNTRGSFTVGSSQYRLVPTAEAPVLLDCLDQAAYFEGGLGLSSLQDVEHYLRNQVPQ